MVVVFIANTQAGLGPNLVNIDNSQISFNVATTGDGGGIFAEDDGDLVINNSDILNNDATAGSGGGIFAINNAVVKSQYDLSI